MSEAPFPHLSTEARLLMAESKEKRIEYVRMKRWISYPVAKAIEDKLAALVSHERVERMPCALVVGESNNGKSRLLEHFAQKYPVQWDNGVVLKAPVLSVDAAGRANEAEFLINIVEATGVTYNPNDKPTKLYRTVIRLLKEYHVKVLLIDEFNLMASGTIKEQRNVLNRVRLISKAARVSIVAFGTQQALPLLTHESQFETRFEPLPLGKWRVSNDDTLDVLATFEKRIPLPKESELDGAEFALEIVTAGEGTIGGILGVVQALATFAIENDEPRMTRKMIKDCGWIPYSQRQQRAYAQL